MVTATTVTLSTMPLAGCLRRQIEDERRGRDKADFREFGPR